MAEGHVTITNNVAASDVYFLCALRHIGVMQVSLLFMQLLLGGVVLCLCVLTLCSIKFRMDGDIFILIKHTTVHVIMCSKQVSH